MKQHTDRYNLNLGRAASDMLHARAWAAGKSAAALIVDAVRRAGLLDHDGELLARYHAAGSPHDRRKERAAWQPK